MGKSRYRLTFGFDCDGIHPNLPDTQMEAIYQGMTQGFKELPEGKILTVRMSSYADDRERMEYLWHLQDQSPNPALKYIATSEIKKLEVLTAKGGSSELLVKVGDSAKPTLARTKDARENMRL